MHGMKRYLCSAAGGPGTLTFTTKQTSLCFYGWTWLYLLARALKWFIWQVLEQEHVKNLGWDSAAEGLEVRS